MKTKESTKKNQTIGVNTSSTQDFSQYGKQDTSKEIIRVNMLIIREIFNSIRPKQITYSMFYNAIYSGNKSGNAEASYSTLIYNGQGNLKIFSEKLIEYGISAEYFAERLIDADECILDYFKGNAQDSVQTPISACRDVLNYNIFSVKNLDGTLIIDCIKNIIDDILGTPAEKNESLYILTDKIADKKPSSHLSQKQVLDYYKNVVKNHPLDSIMDETVMDMPEGTLAEKKFLYYSESEKISATLFLIQETYRLFASLENIPDYMEKFYSYLEIPENEYQDMADNDTIKTKHLMKKLEPFKYPASLFRSDSPTKLTVCKEIAEAYSEYRLCKISYEAFQSILKLNLFYKVSTDNIGLVIPTYALVNEIGYSTPLYFDSLSDDEKNLYLWLQILSE